MIETPDDYEEEGEQVLSAFRVETPSERDDAVKSCLADLAGEFPAIGGNRQMTDFISDLAEILCSREDGGRAALNFIRCFKGLCKGDTANLQNLFHMAHKVCERWGRNGCDMVSAHYYPNLDFTRFAKVMDVFSTYPDGCDIQEGVTGLWWLLGLLGNNNLLENDEWFDFFVSSSFWTSHEVAMAVADLVCRYGGNDPPLNLGWCCREIAKAGGRDLAHEFMAIPGIATVQGESRMNICREALSYISRGEAEQCRLFLKSTSIPMLNN